MDENEIFSDEGANQRRRVGNEPASEAVVVAVAEARGRNPLDLPPLYDAVDPDMLDDLFGDAPSGKSHDSRVTFDYCGCTVTLLGPDEIVVNVND